MNEDLRRQMVREFPELAAGYHLPILGEVLSVPDAPKQGGINDNYRPRLAVNVVVLDSNLAKTEMLLDHVPVAIMGGGNERGFFAVPEKGTLVEIAFFNASPERPFVRSVIGERQALPWNDAKTMSWQQSERAKQSVDATGNWKRETGASITDKSHERFVTAQKKIETLGEELKRVLQSSVEDVDGIKQIEAGALHQLSMTVANILALNSINLVAGDHITRNASKDIKDKAGADLTQTAKNIKQQAETNLELLGQKIHVGTSTDNLLTLVSEFMQTVSDAFTAIGVLTVTCTAPGNPSGVPINAAAFTNAVTALTQTKAKVDAMT